MKKTQMKTNHAVVEVVHKYRRGLAWNLPPRAQAPHNPSLSLLYIGMGSDNGGRHSTRLSFHVSAKNLKWNDILRHRSDIHI